MFSENSQKQICLVKAEIRNGRPKKTMQVLMKMDSITLVFPSVFKTFWTTIFQSISSEWQANFL